MKRDAIGEAVARLKAHGEAAKDMRLKKYADSKKAAPAPTAAPSVCQECGGEIVDGVCAKCGYKEGDESGLADLLEQGAKE